MPIPFITSTSITQTELIKLLLKYVNSFVSGLASAMTTVSILFVAFTCICQPLSNVNTLTAGPDYIRFLHFSVAHYISTCIHVKDKT